MNNVLSTKFNDDWFDRGSHAEVDDLVSNFNSIMLDTAKIFIPNRAIRIRPRDKPYYTHDCKRADRVRNRAHAKFKRTRNPADYENFKEKRRLAKLTRRNAKKAYDERTASKLSSDTVSSRDYWKLTKSVLGVKVKPGIPVLIDGDDIHSTRIEKANIFNAHFAAQCCLDFVPASLPPLRVIPNARLHDIAVTENDVIKILNSLNGQKANGPDGISARLLIEISLSIQKPLTAIFNQSFAQNKFPIYKFPVYKKGDRQLKTNYRPITTDIRKNNGETCFQSPIQFLPR